MSSVHILQRHNIGQKHRVLIYLYDIPLSLYQNDTKDKPDHDFPSVFLAKAR